MTFLIMNQDNDNFGEMDQGIFLSPEAISLTPEQIDWAVRLSQHTSAQDALTEGTFSEDPEWQVYLNALALQGVSQWLQSRSPHLALKSAWLEHGDRLPSSVNLSQADLQSIDCFQAGDFRLRLLVQEDPQEIVISVPKVLLDRPEAHFYVWVEVLEESAQVSVSGYLRCEQLARLPIHALETDADTYLLPWNWFEANPGQLLLYLQLLEASAFAVQPLVTTPTIAQRTINAGLWLRNQLDQVAQELTWIVLPPEPNWAMRGSRSSRLVPDSLDAVMAELIARRQIEIPPQIGQAYQDVTLGETVLRLYAVVWQVGTSDLPDWMLLLILTTPTGVSLPAGAKLRVSDETQLLADRQPERNRDSYIYAQVRGEQGERFYVSLWLNEIEVVLPAFEFNLHPSA